MDASTSSGSTARFDEHGFIKPVFDNSGYIKDEYANAKWLFNDADPEDISLYIKEIAPELAVRLTEAERREIARHSIAILERETPWSVLDTTLAPDTLFDVPSVIDRISVDPRDYLLFNGSAAEDLIMHTSLELDDYESFEFGSRVDFIAAVGAYACQKLERGNLLIARGTTIHGDGNTVSSIGGDIHGDFKISQKRSYMNGSLDSLGKSQLFCPDTPEITLAAYHSVEPAMLDGLLFWAKQLGAGKPEIIGIFKAAYGQVEQELAGQHITHTTAEQAFSALDIDDAFVSDLNGVVDEATGWRYCYESFMYNLGENSPALGMFITPDDTLIFTYFSKGKIAEASPRITFQPSDLPELARALLFQAASSSGRTPLPKLLNHLNKYLDLNNDPRG